MALVDVGSGEIFSFLNDRLGTPQMLADSTNTIVWEGIYKPFGEADVNPNSSVVNNFRFPGQYYDEEIGLYYNWHRYYDPQTGRYLTPDPIGLDGGTNLWIYTSNNPINLIDPDGLEPMFGNGLRPMFGSDVCEISGEYDSTEAFEEFLLEYYGLNLDELKLQSIQLNLFLISIVFESPTSIMKGTVSKKLSLKWDQNSQRWRDVATGRYTKGPKLPKGFGKPSTWKEGMKDVSNEMIATKEGKKVYEQMRDSSIQDNIVGAFEHALKVLLKKK